MNSNPENTAKIGQKINRPSKHLLASLTLVTGLFISCQSDNQTQEQSTESVVQFKGLAADMRKKDLQMIKSPVKENSPETSCSATRIADGWLTLARHCITGVPGLQESGAAATDNQPAVLQGDENHWFSLWEGEKAKDKKRLGKIDIIIRGDNIGPDLALVHEEGANAKPGIPIADCRPRVGETYTLTGYPSFARGRRTTDEVIYLDTILSNTIPRAQVSPGQLIDVYGVPSSSVKKGEEMKGYSGATLMKEGQGYSINHNGLPPNFKIDESYELTLPEILGLKDVESKQYSQYILAAPLNNNLVQDWLTAAN